VSAARSSLGRSAMYVVAKSETARMPGILAIRRVDNEKNRTHCWIVRLQRRHDLAAGEFIPSLPHAHPARRLPSDGKSSAGDSTS